MLILDRLEAWSESRGITKQIPTTDGFCSNIVMELGEFLDKPKHTSKHDEIDAVADIVVFCITEQFRIGTAPAIEVRALLLGDSAYETWLSKTATLEDESPLMFNLKIVKLLGYYAITDKPTREDSVRVIDKMILQCLTKMVTMGYNPLKVMDEVVKVIESRVGEWCEASNKFQKDRSAEAVANWYTPNYHLARR